MEEQKNIGEEFKSFKLIPHQFFDVFWISVPDFLEEFSEQDKMKILPAPEVNSVTIFSNKSKDILLQISKSKNEVQSNNIKVWLHELMQKNLRLIPGFQLFGCATKTINDVAVGCLDYKSNGLDIDMYTVAFAFFINDFLFQGNWVAPLLTKEECLQTFFAIINTLHTEL